MYCLFIDYPSEESWLCGNIFSAADINATILMLRLNMLGLMERYCTSKRPAVCDYTKRLMERPPARKIKELSTSLPALFRKRLMKIVAKNVLKAGAVLAIVGAGVYIYKKYK